MRRHSRAAVHRRGARWTFAVAGLAPSPEFEHDLLPDQILGFALDQRAFGPRRLMVAFGAPDGRFLLLTHTARTHPVDHALEASLTFFDEFGRGGEARAGAVVLCDQGVDSGGPSPEFIATFERAQELCRHHQVHLVDWMACDDRLIRCARRRTFTPEPEPGWWDVPDAA